jgi:hypothetical protein
VQPVDPVNEGNKTSLLSFEVKKAIRTFNSDVGAGPKKCLRALMIQFPQLSEKQLPDRAQIKNFIARENKKVSGAGPHPLSPVEETISRQDSLQISQF